MAHDQPRQFDQLPPALERELVTFCEVTGDKPWDVIAAALTVHFDELDHLMANDPFPDPADLRDAVEPWPVMGRR